MNQPGDGPSPAPEYPVFVRRGDARHEVEALVRSVGPMAAAAGLHKTIYAAQADQTVVLVTSRETPLATKLRAAGWQEPRDPPAPSRS